MRKHFMMMTLSMMITATIAGTSYAGEWKNDDKGYWYVQDDSSIPKAKMVEIDGVTYGFDDAGYMVKGWKNYGGLWYYFDETSGGIVSGWKQLKDQWYYMKPAMNIGWLDLNGNRYYTNKDGVMQTGWFEVEGSPYLYRAGEDGKLIRNKLDDSAEKTTGIVYQYREDGTILYKSSNTQRLQTSWKELMAGEAQELNISEQKEELKERIKAAEEKCVKNYFSKVISSRLKKNYSEKLNNWKKNTEEQLKQNGADDEEIKCFIKDVLAGFYEEDGTYNPKDSYSIDSSEYEEDEDYEYED